jgi:hypothetical protein
LGGLPGMNEMVLDLVSIKVDASRVRRVSSNKGGEWHSPCPACGGNDRFHIWPNQSGGETAQRAGVSGTFWCRQCGVTGDVITLLKITRGLDYKAACQELRVELAGTDRTRQPLRHPQRASSGFVPREWGIPTEKWRGQATKIALAAHANLLGNDAALAYLAKRGLPLAAVVQYRIGYLEGEGKNKNCLYRARAAFDLPERKKDGKPSPLWIPRGITIPLWNDEEVHRLRIRRRKGDLREQDAKYLLLEGSSQAPMVLMPEGVSPALATWVVLEAELDACAVHRACEGSVGVIAALTNVGKPDAAAHRLLSQAKRILVALDFDTPDSKGKRAGYNGWLWWRDTYAVARRWPVPQGKDPGDAFALGVDLAAWIKAACPEQQLGSFSASDSGQQALGQGAKEDVPASPYAPLRQQWPGAKASIPLGEAQLPPGLPYSLEFLRRVFAGATITDEFLFPCPKTAPKPWKLREYKHCIGCPGNHLCLIDFLTSQQMLAPAEVEG